MRLIDADALKRYIPTRMDMQDLYLPVHFKTLIDEQPTVDAVPWEFLERYADWFCASASFPKFIREAKAFYKSSVAAMDGFVITDGERR